MTQLTFDIQRFENSAKQNGVRYWWAHEFMYDLGYESWQSFHGVINKAISSCAKLDLDVSEAFISDHYIDESGKAVKTYKLTRFACFLVTTHADTKKPQAAAAKLALAAIAEHLVADKIRESDLGRIEVRNDLKIAENIMSGVAQDAGLENTRFGIFKDAGFRGMYNMSLADLKIKKNVDGGKTLYDFMGLEELAGNLFRATQTAARIKNQNVRGEKQLFKTASDVGSEVRKMMISNSGTAPENLAVEENIAKVKSRLKATNKAMGKLDNKVLKKI